METFTRPAGEPLYAQDAEGNLATMVRDPLGRVVQTLRSATGASQGEQPSEDEPGGLMGVNFFYGSMGRLMQKTPFSLTRSSSSCSRDWSPSAAVTAPTVYSYDLPYGLPSGVALSTPNYTAGRLVSASNGISTVALSYDASGNFTQRAESFVDWQSSSWNTINRIGPASSDKRSRRASGPCPNSPVTSQPYTFRHSPTKVHTCSYRRTLAGRFTSRESRTGDETMASKTASTEIADLTARQKALKREIGNKTVTLAGKTYTGTALADMCGRRISADEKVEETHRNWLAAVADRDAMRKEQAPVFGALKSYVQATYGKTSQTVGDFGYKPAEVAVRSAETKAAAVVKLRATRNARHTMGRKQRKSVKGTVQLVPAARAVS